MYHFLESVQVYPYGFVTIARLSWPLVVVRKEETPIVPGAIYKEFSEHKDQLQFHWPLTSLCTAPSATFADSTSTQLLQLMKLMLPEFKLSCKLELLYKRLNLDTKCTQRRCPYMLAVHTRGPQKLSQIFLRSPRSSLHLVTATPLSP